MDFLSDKNLICIILTAFLALCTIGSAFHAGNYVLGWETLFIWCILYAMLPCAKIIKHKILCPLLTVNFKKLFFSTVENKYIFISFCSALLVSMIFDDILNYTGRFVEDKPFLDLMTVFVVVGTSFLISISFYYLLTKNKIDKLKKYGIKTDVLIQDVKFLFGKCYVIAYAINPLTEEKVRIIGTTFASSRKEIPQWMSVYFDNKNSNEYFFDTYSWLGQSN